VWFAPNRPVSAGVEPQIPVTPRLARLFPSFQNFRRGEFGAAPLDHTPFPKARLKGGLEDSQLEFKLD
jgi:hypothetical protein